MSVPATDAQSSATPTTTAPVARPQAPRTPLEIDLVDNVVRAGGIEIPIEGDGHAGALFAFLSLVQQLRDTSGPVTLRTDDLATLAAALDLPPHRVEEQLRSIMPAEAHPARARTLAFAIAGLVLVFGVTAAVIATRAQRNAPTRVSTDASTTLVTSTTEPATTTVAPETTAPTTVPVTTTPQRPSTATTAGDQNPPTTLPPVIIDPPPGGFPDRVER